MGFFSFLWKVVTQPVVTIVQATTEVVSTVIDTTTDVVTSVTGSTAQAVSWIPVAGPVTAAVVDEFNFQLNNLTDRADDYQATVADLVDLTQYLIGDVLDPSTNDIQAALEQAGVYIQDTYLQSTLTTIQSSLESAIDFG